MNALLHLWKNLNTDNTKFFDHDSQPRFPSHLPRGSHRYQFCVYSPRPLSALMHMYCSHRKQFTLLGGWFVVGYFFYTNSMIQYRSFFKLPFSLNNQSWSAFCIDTYRTTSFIVAVAWYSVLWIYHGLFSLCRINWLLGCFHFFCLTKDVLIDASLCTCVSVSLE